MFAHGCCCLFLSFIPVRLTNRSEPDDTTVESPQTQSGPYLELWEAIRCPDLWVWWWWTDSRGHKEWRWMRGGPQLPRRDPREPRDCKAEKRRELSEEQRQHDTGDRKPEHSCTNFDSLENFTAEKKRWGNISSKDVISKKILIWISNCVQSQNFTYTRLTDFTSGTFTLFCLMIKWVSSVRRVLWILLVWAGMQKMSSSSFGLGSIWYLAFSVENRIDWSESNCMEKVTPFQQQLIWGSIAQNKFWPERKYTGKINLASPDSPLNISKNTCSSSLHHIYPPGVYVLF